MILGWGGRKPAGSTPTLVDQGLEFVPRVNVADPEHGIVPGSDEAARDGLRAVGVELDDLAG
jgi:hypothetical protein